MVSDRDKSKGQPEGTAFREPAAQPAPKPSPKGPLEPGSVVDEKFRIERLLGRGGMGAVYLATDLKLKRQVALKTLKAKLVSEDATFLARFEQEAVAAANVDHPAIPAIHHSGEHNGILYYVMQYITGSETLWDRVDRATQAKTFVPLEEVRAYFSDAALGLHAVHEFGIIHRDIKLENLLVYTAAKGPGLKILDFGVAHFPESNLTHTGQLLGTPTFFAPEHIDAIFNRHVTIDHRVDLFALGVALYITLTGKQPFAGADHQEVFKEIRTVKPPLPSEQRPDLPRGWDHITMRLLEKDPDDRYLSGQSLHEDLQRVDALAGYTPPRERDTASGRARKPPLPELGEAGERRSLPSLAPGALNTPLGDVVPPADVPVLEPAEASAEPLAQDGGSPRARLMRLPGRVRLALGSGLAGLAAVVLAFAFSTPRARIEAPSGQVLDPEAIQARPERVTAEDILRDQQRSRHNQVLALEPKPATAAPPAAEPAPEPAAKDAAPAKPRAASRRPAARTEAGRDPAPGPAAANNEPAAPPPRRKKNVEGMVQFFGSPEPAPVEPEEPAKTLGIPTGTLVAAKLFSPLINTAPNGQVIAVLADGLELPGAGVLIPKGSRAIGRPSFRVIGEQGRVEIQFSKLVFPDRTERTFAAIAVNKDGSAGLLASVTKTDGRTAANLAEGALDVVEGVLRDQPGAGAAGRFTGDERRDARELRDSTVIIQVPKNTAFQLQLTKAL